LKMVTFSKTVDGVTAHTSRENFGFLELGQQDHQSSHR
jgi:hypothetical protein